jgi:hypothetical protein
MKNNNNKWKLFLVSFVAAGKDSPCRWAKPDLGCSNLFLVQSTNPNVPSFLKMLSVIFVQLCCFENYFVFVDFVFEYSQLHKHEFMRSWFAAVCWKYEREGMSAQLPVHKQIGYSLILIYITCFIILNFIHNC